MIITDQLHVIQKRRRREKLRKKHGLLEFPPCFAPLDNKGGGILIKNSSDRALWSQTEFTYYLLNSQTDTGPTEFTLADNSKVQ